MKPRCKTKPPIFDLEGYQTNIKDLNGTPLPDLSKVWTMTPQEAANHGSEPTFAFWDNLEDAIYDSLPENK